MSGGTQRISGRVAVVIVVTVLALRGVGRGVACPSACDDANACNGIESCDVETGQCRPGVLPSCDDTDPCTADSCDPQLGCTYAPLPGVPYWTCAILEVYVQLGDALALIRSTPAAEIGGAGPKRRLAGDVVAMQG